MSELRKDYILNRWVLINEHRKKRPHQFKKPPESVKVKTCFFCPGNEETTPPEIGRVEYKGNWKIRWFPNLFAAVNTKENLKCVNSKHFTHCYGYGYHEVIAETPYHNKQLADLSIEDIKDLLNVYSVRIKELSKRKNVKYVSVFKNHGPEGGTSIVHSHSQIVTLPRIPSLVMDEVEAIKKFKRCPYCDIIKKEKKSQRRIVENHSFVAFAPYASRFNYEAWIFPKKHVRNITEFDDKELLELAFVLKKILIKIKSLGLSYNYYLHYSPMNENLHFHIEVIPREAIWAGFEYSSNIIINSISPESAAKFYRSR